MCLVAYLVAIIHEMGHLIMVKFLGYGIKGVRIEPFGVCLKLSENISDCCHELLISLAGPVTNVLMLGAGTALTYVNVVIPQVYFISNFYMLFINLLPVMPLDGGRALRALLKIEVGEKKSKEFLKMASVPVVCIMAGVGVILLFKSKINISLLLASVFMCNNIKLRSDKPTEIASLYTMKLTCDSVKSFYVNEKESVKDAIKMLPFKELCVVFVVSDSGEIKRIITNKYILGVGSGCMNLKMSDV